MHSWIRQNNTLNVIFYIASTLNILNIDNNISPTINYYISYNFLSFDYFMQYIHKSCSVPQMTIIYNLPTNYHIT